MNNMKHVGYSAILMLSLITGCSSDDSKAKGEDDGGARYAVSTGVLAGDEFIGYITTVPSLEAGTSVNLDNALEIEPSWLFSQPGEPYVYAASIFSPTIVRYALGKDGTLAEDEVVSFANLGLQSAYLAAAAPVYSGEKSYFVDDLQDQIVIWNPKRMEVIGTIPLDDGNDGDLPPAAEGTIVEHHGRLLTVIHWSDNESDMSLYGSHVRLVAIDPETDTIVDATDEERLSHAAPLGRGTDGSLYYSPGSFIAALTEVAPGHGSPSR